VIGVSLIRPQGNADASLPQSENLELDDSKRVITTTEADYRLLGGSQHSFKYRETKEHFRLSSPGCMLSEHAHGQLARAKIFDRFPRPISAAYLRSCLSIAPRTIIQCTLPAKPRFGASQSIRGENARRIVDEPFPGASPSFKARRQSLTYSTISLSTNGTRSQDLCASESCGVNEELSGRWSAPREK